MCKYGLLVNISTSSNHEVLGDSGNGNGNGNGNGSSTGGVKVTDLGGDNSTNNKGVREGETEYVVPALLPLDSTEALRAYASYFADSENSSRFFLWPSLPTLTTTYSSSTQISQSTPLPIGSTSTSSTLPPHSSITTSETKKMDSSYNATTLKSQGFLPHGMFEKILSRALIWSRDSNNTKKGFLLHRNRVILFIGCQKIQMIERHDINCIQVDVQGNALGIHHRLLIMLKAVISDCLQSLTITTLLPYVTIGTGTDVESCHYFNLESVRNVFITQMGFPFDEGWFSANEALKRYSGWLIHIKQCNDMEKYDVFLSYRWGIYDSPFAMMLYDSLTLHTLTYEKNRALVSFLDRMRLVKGGQFQNDFVDALLKTMVFIPIVTFDSLQAMHRHDNTKVDNVLVEWWCALLCWQTQKSSLKAILPIMFGKHSESLGMIHIFRY